MIEINNGTEVPVLLPVLGWQQIKEILEGASVPYRIVAPLIQALDLQVNKRLKEIMDANQAEVAASNDTKRQAEEAAASQAAAAAKDAPAEQDLVGATPDVIHDPS